MPITEKDLKRMGLAVVGNKAVRIDTLPKAKDKRGRRGVMNTLESQYRDRLERLRDAGVIFWYGFEVMRLAVAKSDRERWYTPDFVVVMPGGEIEFHEVKGRKHDGGMLRLAVSADRYPFRFFLATFNAYSGWTVDPVRKDAA